ncbi:ribonuclease H-like domain-containing protein [Tanacetum coccineum]
MEVLQHEHPLTLIDLNPEYPRDEVVYDDEEELIMKQDFRCPCGRCGQEINFYHRYYYTCDQCDYSLHKLCAELPTTLRHESHRDHILILCQVLGDKWHCATTSKKATLNAIHLNAIRLNQGAVSSRLPQAFSAMTIRDPTWNMDTGASSHLNSHSSNLSIVYNNRLYLSVCVGDGKTIPVTNTSHSILPTLSRPLYLHNVLVIPNIIKNLISVRQFTRDNKCSVEFDEFGFSVKDFLTRHILLKCDSSGDLYPVTKPSPIPSALLSINPTTWHQHLGYLGAEVL